ncbi:trans-resveratrol di-O-methyltransferase-like [Humulus lupulus]|uniref:trans-resveratrol di-O-methyltransferase-like n=1 Tax=Humulus lupulus TaxID=3486 RepID=UPI002B412DC1|nr:trans-resveratrol di-O-methyltransferase-like [Humulus lupulus]
MAKEMIMATFDGQGSNNNSELFQAQSHLYKHALCYITSMCLKSAVELGIPDIINNHNGQSITLPELVSALHLPPAKNGFVHRLMRLLVHSGFFTSKKISQNQEEQEAYDLTPSSRLLLKDKVVVQSLSPFVLAMLDPAFMAPWHFLGSWLQKDESATTPFELAHEMSIFEYMSKNTEFSDLFNGAMASDSGMMKLVVKDIRPVFEGLCSLVDVGGGTGGVCRILIEAFPHLKCKVLELPHVIADLPNTENLIFVEGDMFQAIPQADALLLKWILHDWSDEECLTILKKCREAIPSYGGGKVVIIDIVINDQNDELETAEAKLYLDLLMMTLATGRERSEKDWEKLFLEAGFTRYKIIPIFGLKSLIEVFP